MRKLGKWLINDQCVKLEKLGIMKELLCGYLGIFIVFINFSPEFLTKCLFDVGELQFQMLNLAVLWD